MNDTTKTPEQIAAEAAAKKAAEKAEKDAKKAAEKEAKKLAEKEAKDAAKAEKAAAKEANKMPEQNGIRRPKPNTETGKVWALADSISVLVPSMRWMRMLSIWAPLMASTTVSERCGLSRSVPGGPAAITARPFWAVPAMADWIWAVEPITEQP